MNKLQAVLKKQGRSQLWLANQLDITTSTMSTWCTNRSQPSLEKLFKVAEILNVEVTELLETKKIFILQKNLLQRLLKSE
jgi:transcriptional regulator with XRE-family HTH domain